jgi:rhodanese-related sulfurtransferase
MKTSHSFLLLVALAAICARDTVHAAERPIPNPNIDFAGYARAVQETKDTRAAHRVTESRFMAMAADPGTVILDARSADKYKLRHIKGAVNLPFTDFTEESLAKVIPTKTTRVLIYCNNNFNGDRVAFGRKERAASLNISTFVNLVIYGYENVWELGPLLDVKTTELPFEGNAVDR